MYMKKMISLAAVILSMLSLSACTPKPVDTNTVFDVTSETALPSETAALPAESSVSETEAVSAESSDAVQSESAETTAENSDPDSYAGKWYFVKADMVSEDMSFSMSLMDMDITELTAEDMLIMELKEDGTTIIGSAETSEEASWTVTDGGFAVEGSLVELGSERAEFTSMEDGTVKTVLDVDGSDTMEMFFAREGSDILTDSLSRSYLEDSFGDIMDDLLEASMAEITVDTPAALDFTGESSIMFCRFTAVEDGEYTFRSESSGFDTAIIYSDSSFEETLCDSENTEGGFELSHTMKSGETVYIEVESDSEAVKVFAEKK